MNSNEIAQNIERIDQRCINLTGGKRTLNVHLICFGLAHWRSSTDSPRLSFPGKTPEEAFLGIDEALSKLEMQQHCYAAEFGMAVSA